MEDIFSRVEDSRHAVSSRVLEHYKSLKSGKSVDTNDQVERRPLEGDWYIHTLFANFVLTLSPICYEDFAEATLGDTIYCKAMCGNNFHKECFNQWAKSKRQERLRVTCGKNYIQYHADSFHSLLPN